MRSGTYWIAGSRIITGVWIEMVNTKHFIAFSAATITVFCSGCIKLNGVKEYDISTDCVQIGFRVHTGEKKPETAYFRFGFPWWFENSKESVLYGLDLTPAVYDNGTLNGLGISLASMRHNTNGMILSALCSAQLETRGVSVSPVNLTLPYSPSLQLGLWNIGSFPFDQINGAAVQLACLNQADRSEFQIGLCNLCHLTSDFQLGLLNFGRGIPKSKQLKRTFLQIGLYNSSENGVIQIGLLNHNGKSALFKWFPLFNCAKTRTERKMPEKISSDLAS